MNEFGTIECLDQLEHAIAFISQGYGWNESQTAAIRRGIITCNTGGHAYGAWLTDSSGKVVNAILFFYQGKIRVNGQVKTVVGTSSWYVDEAHRGLAAIRFLNSAIAYLKSHYSVITNYTPNDVATDLYRRLGFKYQSVMRVKLFVWDSLRFIGRRKLRIAVKEDLLEYAQGFGHLGALRAVELKLHNTTVTLVIRVHKVKRLRVSLNVVEILWADDYQTLSENISIAALKLCVRELAVAAHFYMNSAAGDKSCAWLVFDSEDSVSFVSPVQSELTCI